jgi:hypothetical protein
MPRNGWRLSALPVALAGWLAAAGLGAWPAVARGEGEAAVAALRLAGATVEIEVAGSQPFPVRALPPVLAIGESRFARSRPPEDGSLATLVFLVPLEDFAELADGDPMRLGYGLSAGAPGPAAEPVWDLGPLDKSGIGP